MPQPIPESVRSSEVPVLEESSSAKHLVGGLAHAVDNLLDSYPTTATEAAIALVEKTTDLVAELVHSVSGLLSGLVPEWGPSPATGSLSSGLVSSGSNPVLLIAVLVLFSIALVQGKLSWLRSEPLRPRAGPQLAIERPG